MRVEEYRALEAKTRRRGKDPEQELQEGWVVCIREILPPEVKFTASAAGVPLTPKVRSDLKAAGLEPGWPDLQFLFPDGITRYIEDKTPVGSLRPAQRAFRDACGDRDIWALARTWSDIETALARWCALNCLALKPLHPLTRARFGR